MTFTINKNLCKSEYSRRVRSTCYVHVWLVPGCCVRSTGKYPIVVTFLLVEHKSYVRPHGRKELLFVYNNPASTAMRTKPLAGPIIYHKVLSPPFGFGTGISNKNIVLLVQPSNYLYKNRWGGVQGDFLHKHSYNSVILILTAIQYGGTTRPVS